VGRIDVILPDELEHKLRMEVGKRMGAKRGNLTEAIKEAIDLWLKQEEVDRLAERAIQKGISISEKNNIINTLFTYHHAAIPAYVKMIESKTILDEERQQIYDNIQKINES
jgi:Arc/MetJ-type ribon-helix-helix transcriptional regulator